MNFDNRHQKKTECCSFFLLETTIHAMLVHCMIVRVCVQTIIKVLGLLA